MTPADVLDAAADYIRTHGLAKGAFKVYNGSVCALGAIYEIAGGYADERNTYVRAESALAETIGMWPPNWNDHPSRTADEVMDALMESAARWREEHEG